MRVVRQGEVVYLRLNWRIRIPIDHAPGYPDAALELEIHLDRPEAAGDRHSPISRDVRLVRRPAGYHMVAVLERHPDELESPVPVRSRVGPERVPLDVPSHVLQRHAGPGNRLAAVRVPYTADDWPTRGGRVVKLAAVIRVSRELELRVFLFPLRDCKCFTGAGHDEHIPRLDQLTFDPDHRQPLPAEAGRGELPIRCRCHRGDRGVQLTVP